MKNLISSLSIPLLLLSFITSAIGCGTNDTLSPTGRMATARASHTATLLSNGKVLIAGGMERNDVHTNSAELYDSATGRFVVTGNMNVKRSGHTATRLSNGKVLIAGGSNMDWLSSAEIYDPSTGVFTLTGNMSVRRGGATATFLADGRVLILGGYDGGLHSGGEIYDPATDKFTATGNMGAGRSAHTATLLSNGKVLITGGGANRNVLASSELYDPASGTFAKTGDMSVVRHKHAAIKLPNGDVLIVGGSDNRDWRGRYASAEIYKPAAGTFSAAGNMNTARFKLPASVNLLNNGMVFVAGGDTRTETYNRATNTFNVVKGEMDAARFYSTATLLSDGGVLIIGGYNTNIEASAGAWLYKQKDTKTN